MSKASEKTNETENASWRHFWQEECRLNFDPFINGYPIDMLVCYRGQKVVLRTRGGELYNFSVPRKKQIVIETPRRATGFLTKDDAINRLVIQNRKLLHKLKGVRESRKRLLDKIDMLTAENQWQFDEAFNNPDRFQTKLNIQQVTDHKTGGELVENGSLDIDSDLQMYDILIYNDTAIHPAILKMLRTKLAIVESFVQKDFESEIDKIAKSIGLRVWPFAGPFGPAYIFAVSEKAEKLEPFMVLNSSPCCHETTKQILLNIDVTIDANKIISKVSSNIQRFYAMKTNVTQRTVYNFLKKLLAEYVVRVKQKQDGADIVFCIAERGTREKDFKSGRQYVFGL